ncbi:hypothetical protein M5689_000335 [Euphorbia peplus]|nr:hypothetical protein M5689_000335 [Euphorbia peplus]
MPSSNFLIELLSFMMLSPTEIQNKTKEIAYPSQNRTYFSSVVHLSSDVTGLSKAAGIRLNERNREERKKKKNMKKKKKKMKKKERSRKMKKIGLIGFPPFKKKRRKLRRSLKMEERLAVEKKRKGRNEMN